MAAHARMLILLVAALSVAGCAATPRPVENVRVASIATTPQDASATLPPPWHGAYNGTHVSLARTDRCDSFGGFDIANYDAPNASQLAHVTTLHVKISWNAPTTPTGIWYAFSHRSGPLVMGTAASSPAVIDIPVRKVEAGGNYAFGACPSPAGAFVLQEVDADISYS